jgi:predicted amidohydrolase YtcJ
MEGGGWDRNLWSETQFPTRHDLDRAAPGLPVALSSKCGHVLWASSRALELAGVSPSTPDPAGGEVERDPVTGVPTGILKETAGQLVRRVVPEPEPLVIEEAMLRAMPCLHRVGVVGIHNCEGASALSAFQRIAARGELGLRVLAHFPSAGLDEAIALGLRTGFGGERLRLGAVKAFADGSLGARTAAMLRPYEDEADNHGIMVIEEKELEAIVRRASNAGIAPAIHAIGDRATRAVAVAYEASRPLWEGHGLRPRIEHAQVVTREDIARLGRLGVVASVQPLHCTADIEMVDRHWGARGVGAYAFRSLLDAGARLAFGSDCPVEDPSPLVGIHAAVTRRRTDGSPCPEGWHPRQRLTVGEAVYAYTQGAAYASGEEHLKGSISPGKLADLVVISKDIFSLDPMEIPQAQVVATVLGGTVVYQSGCWPDTSGSKSQPLATG